MQSARDQGIRAEAGFESKSLKAQMRRANKLSYKYVAILGDDELTKGVVTLKDLAAGTQKEVSFADVLAELTI